MNRRTFVQTTVLAVASCAAPSLRAHAEQSVVPTAKKLPRWRGFNLTEKCVARPGGNRPYAEKDFALLAEWGFDFARLPVSYLCWASHENPRELREAPLKDLDQAVEFGRKHGIHTSLNLHRAPGYCVNPPAEPWDLWKDEPTLEACAFQWGQLAKRFKGVPNERLSFDLLNEPARVAEADYVRVVKRLVQAIRAEDAGRLIIADGLRWGRDPVTSLVELGVAQSTRGYDPMEVSHYQASWVEGADKWPEPTWPAQLHNQKADKEFLRRDRIAPWLALERRGVGVHVGEWGAHNRTPHKVALAWMRDCLELWREVGWGWALWNLRGSFGVLNSGRTDVSYEDFRGDKLDREMLKLLQRY
jgi:endoglucanase